MGYLLMIEGVAAVTLMVIAIWLLTIRHRYADIASAALFIAVILWWMFTIGFT